MEDYRLGTHEFIGCIECFLGVTNAIPYIAWPILKQRCATQEPFRADCAQFANNCSGRTPMITDGRNSVSERQVARYELQAIYEGYTPKHYTEAHKGVTPKEANVPGYVFEHPNTLQNVTMHFVLASLAFRLICSARVSAEHISNLMPSQV